MAKLLSRRKLALQDNYNFMRIEERIEELIN